MVLLPYHPSLAECTQDVKEVFFRLRLLPAAKKIVFLMETTEDGQLTAYDSPGNRPVALSVNLSVMGVSQTPLLPALVRWDLDLDAILQFIIRKMAYVNDLPTASSQMKL